MKAVTLRFASWLWRGLTGLFWLMLLGMAALILVLRYEVLPGIDRYRDDIAAALSKAMGQRIAIAAIQADWDGPWPRLSLSGVTVFDPQGAPGLTLARVDTLLSWQSLVAGELRLRRLAVHAPRLAVQRQADGLIYVSGIPVNRPGARAGLADWILRQGEIIINQGELQWEDRLRGAPALVFEDVGLRLVNDPLLGRHRFGLVGRPPGALATRLDVRGDLRGRSFDDLARWRGTLYGGMPATDLAAWAAWIDFPYPLRQGKGGLQVWLDIDRGQVVGITADLRLTGVRTRLARNLPELDLSTLSGRLAWHELARGFEVEARRLAAEGPGLSLPRTNFSLRYQAGDGRQSEQGRVRAEGVALEPLIQLASHLPLAPAQRAILSEVAPTGWFRQLALDWQGPLEAPTRYSAKAVFSGLGVRAHGKLPGFSNLSGSVDLDEGGGTLLLSGRHTAFDLPLIMRNPVGFDTLEAAASWQRRDGRVHLTLSRVAFANADVAGNVSGNYESAPDGPGRVDLTGSLERANARAVHLYLPRIVGEATHDWLRDALRAGAVSDVRLRLKGDLAHFPFADERQGLFHITGRAHGVRLAYAAGWPEAEELGGTLTFRGRRMEIVASQAMLSQVRIPRLKATISDLTAAEEILELEGEAQGATADVIRFVNASPVAAWLDDVMTEASAEGRGRLALRLTLPLRGQGSVRLAGNYQFVDNTLRLGRDLPVLKQVNGRLHFTEKTASASRISLQTLGGPATVGLTTLTDGTLRLKAEGRATAEGLGEILPSTLARALKGSTAWSLSLAGRHGLANLNLASDLVGLESTLPAPLVKTAASALPLRVERRVLDAGQDAVSIGLDRVLAAQFLRERQGDAMRVQKGTLRLGAAAAPAPVHPGVWVDGELPGLDVDRWRAVLDGGGEGLPLAGVHLRVGRLDFLGRRFHRVHLNAWSQGVQWQATVDADEMAGEAAWRSHDGGRLTARLKRLAIPDPLPEPTVAPAGGKDLELPALDITVDDLEIAGLKLGRMDLAAAKRGADWRIDRLRLSNPDAVLEATGLWRSWIAEPATRLDFELEVKDAGRFLARMGHPDRLRRGNARLKGEVAWQGGPASFNLGTLSGRLQLEAHSGQFLKVEPGLGKLLGLISLQSLPRRLMLDFRDVFSEGFAFDNIAATAEIAGGVLSTRDFLMQGPAAVVSISGNTDLVRETQNLRVKVVPTVGEGVAVAGAFLGGPVVGVTALLLQKLLKDPLGQMIAYEYQVTGTWDEPQVVKIGQSGAAQGRPPEGTRP